MIVKLFTQITLPIMGLVMIELLKEPVEARGTEEGETEPCSETGVVETIGVCVGVGARLRQAQV